MIDVFNSLSDFIAAKVDQALHPKGTDYTLRVAVLGPSLARDDLGTRKRRQIFGALKDDGHAPFFPEDEVDGSMPFESILTQECSLLRESEVDLVVILYTETSHGVSQEIARFEAYPEIKAKTAILFPLRLYEGEGVTTNTTRSYLVNQPYSDSQFGNCTVVGWCRKWASDRQSGMWPDMWSHRF